jgi:Peptidase propeptide and YPEB domain
MGVLRTFGLVLLLVVLATGAAFEARAWVASDTAPASLLVPEAPASLETPAPTAPSRVMATAGVSMDQAVKMAEQRYKARVVRAEAQHDGPRTVYVLKLLNEAGHVWTVRVDAANGAIL